MKAIQVARFGPPEVLTAVTVQDPVAGPGEVVITVAAADVLFLDVLIRSGRAAEWFPVQPPYVPGNGVAGRVTAVGEGADPGWAGQRVISRTGGHGGSGGYAQQAAVPAERLIPVPDSAGLPEAAAVLHDGATALGLAASTGIKPDDWVLIVGAAGGLGITLLQLARASGARVIGAARGTAKLGLITGQGAEAAVDYSEPGWTEQVVKATGGGPDVVFDGVGGRLGSEAFGIVAEGGRFSAHGSASGAFAVTDPAQAARRGVTVRGIEQAQFGPGEHEALARRAVTELAAGRIRPVIGQAFPLERAADAHTALESRTAIGKTLLTLP